jgi:peptidoglycan-associated lipoprotein
MQKNLMIAIAGTLLLALAGCAGKSAVKAPAPVAAGGTAAGTQAGAAGQGVANAGSVGAAEGSGVSAPSGVSRLVYFDFDSSEIRPEFVPVIAAHARAIAANASIHVRLEGHTDERGSPEYNIGLGERRAQNVRRALLLQGVAESQVTTVSYGEERPVATGQTEEDWAKNRRVEFVYLN